MTDDHFCLYHELPEGRADRPSRGIALGIFDGFHLGHQALIRALRRVCRERGLRVAVFTFSFPSGVAFGGRDLHHRELMNDAERVLALRSFGVEDIYMIPMTEQISSLSPETFLTSIVMEKLGGAVLAVGEDAHFGYRGAGDAAYLESFAAGKALEAVVVPDVFRDGLKVSSTRIRSLISKGDVNAATALMTRPLRLFCDLQRDGVPENTRSSAPVNGVADRAPCPAEADEESLVLSCPYPERSIVLPGGVYRTRVFFSEKGPGMFSEVGAFDNAGVPALSEVREVTDRVTGDTRWSLISRVPRDRADALSDGRAKSVAVEILERVDGVI